MDKTIRAIYKPNLILRAKWDRSPPCYLMGIAVHMTDEIPRWTITVSSFVHKNMRGLMRKIVMTGEEERRDRGQ
jgi:hypothetical protein